MPQCRWVARLLQRTATIVACLQHKMARQKPATPHTSSGSSANTLQRDGTLNLRYVFRLYVLFLLFSPPCKHQPCTYTLCTCSRTRSIFENLGNPD
jgi:hypothetical protein